MTEKGKIKICDFEFLYKYEDKKPDFLDSFDLKGVHKDFKNDLPNNQINRTIFQSWDKYLKKSFLLDSIKNYLLDKN